MAMSTISSDDSSVIDLSSSIRKSKSRRNKKYSWSSTETSREQERDHKRGDTSGSHMIEENTLNLNTITIIITDSGTKIESRQSIESTTETSSENSSMSEGITEPWNQNYIILSTTIMMMINNYPLSNILHGNEKGKRGQSTSNITTTNMTQNSHWNNCNNNNETNNKTNQAGRQTWDHEIRTILKKWSENWIPWQNMTTTTMMMIEAKPFIQHQLNDCNIYYIYLQCS